MPFNQRISETRREETDISAANHRIYVSEVGSVRIETEHFRREFAPEEFVAYLREITAKKRRRILPTWQRFPLRELFVFFVAIMAVVTSACGTSSSTNSANKAATEVSPRIVSVGGSVTETIYALGAESKLVGTDTSSIFPEAATKLPQVGYQRTLSSEGVLSLKPTVVLAAAETGPPPAVQQIEAAGVKIVRVSGDHTVEAAKEKIRQIAEAVDAKARGEELITKLDADLTEAKGCTDKLKSKPKVLFVYARGNGAPNVAGSKTAADSMITLAGGQNAVSGFDNYKPLTPEALVAAQPDYILFPTLGLESIGGIDGAMKIPGVAETPAGKNKKIISVDDLILLGFSPRMGVGVKELCGKIQ